MTKKKLRKGVDTIAQVQNAQIQAKNTVMRAHQGHGYAAELANHQIDTLAGRHAELLGEYIKDGADRIVNGIRIQTKYCATATRCVDACLKRDGSPRYPTMVVEVPSDLFEEAVKEFEQRIRNGCVQGITNPRAARKLLRKGHVTYSQAKAIAQAGTIDSLKYDAKDGVTVAGSAAGLSALITYAVAVWNGESDGNALREACVTGLGVGAAAFISSMVTSQATRTAIVNTASSTVAQQAVELLPRGSSKTLLRLLDSGSAGMAVPLSRLVGNGFDASMLRSSGSAALRKVGANTGHKARLTKRLKGDVATIAVSTAIMSARDLSETFRGRMSPSQFVKNIGTNAAGATGGYYGGILASALAGGAKGAPGGALGVVIGAAAGLAGGIIGGAAAGGAAKFVLDGVIEDDAIAMIKIVEDVFAEQASRSLIGGSEAQAILSELSLRLPNQLASMYAASDRHACAAALITPLVDDLVSKRSSIRVPSDKDLMVSLGALLNDPPHLKGAKDPGSGASRSHNGAPRSSFTAKLEAARAEVALAEKAELVSLSAEQKLSNMLADWESVANSAPAGVDNLAAWPFPLKAGR